MKTQLPDQSEGSGYPQAGYPQGSHPQGGYPPPCGYPQGGYVPPGGYPQGGLPPPGGYPQGVYVPPGGYQAQAGYPQPPQPGFQPSVAYGQPGYAGPASGFGEDADVNVKVFDFNDKSIRRSFLRKVYTILMCQQNVTLAVITVFMYHTPTKILVHHHAYIFWIALLILLVCLIAMACCEGVRRQAPTNFIFLGIFTAAESFMLGVTSSMYDSDAAMMAVGITAAVCFALTLFAMQSKWDFTAMSGVLLCAAVVLLLFGIIAILVPGKNITLLCASLGALYVALYLVCDTQLMMRGKHRYRISPDEFIFAVLNLLLDVINVFTFIPTVIRAFRN